MEVTVLQLYKVALSAGKAHRDHKHHHVHHFDHDGLVSTTAQPTLAPQVRISFKININEHYGLPILINYFVLFMVQQTTPHPFLANGAVVNRPNLFAPEPQALQTQFFPGQTDFVSGQFSRTNQLLQQQFTVPPPTASSSPNPTAPVLFPQEPPQAPSIPTSISSSSFVNLNNPANVQFIDAPTQTYGSHVLFKRNENAPRKTIKVRRIIKRAPDANKITRKRALIALSDGSFVDDKNIADDTFVYDGLAQFGADDFQGSFAKQGGGGGGDIEDEIREHDRESAEGEVMAVLSLCSSCEVEPFIGAVALAWKDAKIQPEHALKGRSVGGCGTF